MTTEASGGLPRRRLLGAAATAAAGVAVGGAGFVGGRAVGPGDGEATATGTSISPYGVHQPGVAVPTPRFVEWVALDLLAGIDADALGRLLRLWTGDIVALTDGRGAPGDTAPWLSVARADLTITVGFGPWAAAVDGVSNPAGLAEVPPMRHDRMDQKWSGGDLLVVVGAADGTTVAHAVRRLVADATPFARLRWRQPGFWNGVDSSGQPMTGRNLFGQVDGSGNPQPGSDLFDATVWTKDGPWVGGSTVVLRRIRMDLDTWDTLTRARQEASVGRRLSDGAPLTGGAELDDVRLGQATNGRPVIAVDAHVRRGHPSTNGGLRIFRKGANYVHDLGATDTAPESGLLFASFQADVAGQFVPIQQALDESDALNEWTTAIGSASFAILPGFSEGGWLGESVLA